jgi:autotransporter-associated beta strand protein
MNRFLNIFCFFAWANLVAFSPLQANDWQGTISQDFGLGDNWSNTTLIAGDDCYINIDSSGNYPFMDPATSGYTVPPAPLNSVTVGNVPGTPGRFDLLSGTIDTIGNFVVGDLSGDGTLNMYGGSLTVPQWLIIGNPGVGTMTMGTEGQTEDAPTVDSGFAVVIGNDGGNGTLTMNAGEIDAHDWIDIGRNGGTGALSMYGTSKIVHDGADNILIGDGGSGTLILGTPGGSDNPTLTNNYGAILVRGSSTTMTVNSGTVDANSTDPVGSLLVYSSGSMIMNGGSLTCGANLAMGDGTLTLNSGTCLIPGISTSGDTVINFNGGTLKASGDNNGFIAGSGAALNVLKNTDTGLGAVIDTDGKNVTIYQPLVTGVTGDTDGGLTKLGVGTLKLSAVSAYTGSTAVRDGTLQLQPTPLVAHQEASTAANAVGTRSDGPYNLGRNFTANASLEVTQLGVFDSGGDGLSASHVVHLTDTDTLSDVATVSFTPEASGTYQNGYCFITLDTPLTLNAAGHYLIWAEALGGADPFGDADSGMSVTYDTGTNSITLGAPVWSFSDIPAGWWSTAVNGDASATFMYYNPSGVITADLLPTTTPVVMGGPAGSTPTLDLQGANQQIASLADVSGAVVYGVVTNSDTETPVVLTLGATSGTTTYSGSIDGNLSLVKSGGSTQNLVGSLTYTGNTTVDAGTLTVSSLDTPNATVSVTGDATLTASSITANGLSIGGMRRSGAATVPEPGALVLLALAGAGTLLAAWRRKS